MRNIGTGLQVPGTTVGTYKLRTWYDVRRTLTTVTDTGTTYQRHGSYQVCRSHAELPGTVPEQGDCWMATGTHGLSQRNAFHFIGEPVRGIPVLV